MALPLALAPLLSKALPMISKAAGGASGAGGSKAMGGLMGVATGALQKIQAGKLKREADAALPDKVDPQQAAMLAELNQKRRSIETGADFQSAVQQANAGQATANDAITKASGGDIGATMQGLLQAQQGAGAIKNQAIAQGQTQQQFYDNAAGQLQREMSARTLQLQMLESQQKRAEWNTKIQRSGQNMQAGMAQTETLLVR
jgi:hypothetical protein